MKITELADWMTRGGDARIVLDPRTGLNRYHSAPYPRDILAFASSTANDLSADAMAWLEAEIGAGADVLNTGSAYASYLEKLRDRVRDVYRLPGETDIFFAPSGTDLEYVALLAAAGRKPAGIANLLLGADEVGSGCIHSAAGCYFAHETALIADVSPGQEIAGLPPIVMGDFPVRNAQGEAFDSATLTGQMEIAMAKALDENRLPLVHIVHGSKTGLVLPHLDDIDRLQSRFGRNALFVVDACQARITTQAIHDYLKRRIIVFLTGSKFMGGPPFSGFALLPHDVVRDAAPMACGMATVFRRAEIPVSWPGREAMEDSGNAGLALRLAASLFELDRFQCLTIDRVARVVTLFNQAADRLADRLKARRVAAVPAEDVKEILEHPIEMQTLVTLDLCHDANGTASRNIDFDAAVAIHKAMTSDGVRLGQPVRCVRLADGRWGATLRIGLSMPQVVMLDKMDDQKIDIWLCAAMDKIASALQPRLNTN
ncbi:MAG: hypothetical protein ACRCY3_04895 [Sphingorhabdus sp.]